MKIANPAHTIKEIKKVTLLASNKSKLRVFETLSPNSANKERITLVTICQELLTGFFPFSNKKNDKKGNKKANNTSGKLVEEKR